MTQYGPEFFRKYADLLEGSGAYTLYADDHKVSTFADLEAAKEHASDSSRDDPKSRTIRWQVKDASGKVIWDHDPVSEAAVLSDKKPKRAQVSTKQLVRGETYLVVMPDGKKAELEFLGTGNTVGMPGPLTPMHAGWGDIPLSQASYSTRWIFGGLTSGKQVLFKKGYNKDSKGILVPENTPEDTFSQPVKIYK